MTKVVIDIAKSVEQNAEVYFEKSKKSKKKLKGAKEAVARLEKDLTKAKKDLANAIEIKKEIRKVKKEKRWYHRYRWFITSSGLFAVGGRDATTNDILIRKQLEKNDIIFHTAVPGSPFFVIKCGDKKATKEDIDEAAIATASFSRAWRMGISYADVYHFGPDQIKKELGLPKGTFMIYGKRNYLRPKLEVAVGITKEGEIMAGPPSAVEKNCDKFVVVIQDKQKTSDTAKKIKKKLGGDLDELIRALPSGGCKILKN